MDHFLKQKLKACNDFFSATGLLKEALDKKDPEAVNGMIRRREELKQIIDSLDRRIVRFRRQGSVYRTQATAKIFRELEMILKKIMSVNQDCAAVAADKCDALKKDLAIVRQTEAGVHGYACGAQRVQKFLDIET